MVNLINLTPVYNKCHNILYINLPSKYSVKIEYLNENISSATCIMFYYSNNLFENVFCWNNSILEIFKQVFYTIDHQ